MNIENVINNFTIDYIENMFLSYKAFLITESTSPVLKRNFSSGIEGALASKLNHDFNWKQLSEMILCIFI